MAPRARRKFRVHIEAEEVIKKSGFENATRPRKAPETETGRPFEITTRTRLTDLKSRILRLSRYDKTLLALNDDQIVAAFVEMERRVAGTRPTLNDLVGTFFEIVGGDHPNIKAIRESIVDENTKTGLFAVADGRKVFVSRADIVTTPDGKVLRENAIGLEQLPEPIRKMLSSDNMARKRGETAQAHSDRIELLLAKAQDKVPNGTIRYVYDVRIGGSKYVDAAVLLRLEDGRHLVLLTEEYKSISSGGMNAQQAVRLNRIFDGDILNTTEITFMQRRIGADGKPIRGPGRESKPLRAQDVVFNLDTFTADQLGVKASSLELEAHEMVEPYSVSGTKSVRKRKKVYGESVPRNKKALAVFYRTYLEYPSSSIRRLIESLHRSP